MASAQAVAIPGRNSYSACLVVFRDRLGVHVTADPLTYQELTAERQP